MPELGEDNVISSVFEDILSELLNGRKIQSRNDFLENLIVNSKYKEISRNSIEFKTSSFFREILDQYDKRADRYYAQYYSICPTGIFPAVTV